MMRVILSDLIVLDMIEPDEGRYSGGADIMDSITTLPLRISLFYWLAPHHPSTTATSGSGLSYILLLVVLATDISKEYSASKYTKWRGGDNNSQITAHVILR